MAAYLDTEQRLHEIIEAHPGSLSPALRCILELRRAQGGGDPGATLASVRALDLTGEDPHVAVLLLMRWAAVARLSELHREARAALDRAVELLAAAPCPELRAQVYLREAHLALAQGNQVDAERFVDAAHAALPVTAGRRHWVVLERAHLLGRAGSYVPDAELRALCGRADALGDAARLAGFLAAATRGRAAEALEYLDAIHDADALRVQRKAIDAHLAVLATMQLAAAGSARGAAALERRLHLPTVIDAMADAGEAAWATQWTSVIVALVERRPEEALVRARAQARGDGWAPNVASRNMVRAELACGNAEAARRRLEQIRERGGRLWIDALFDARVALLTGDAVAARQHLAQTLARAEALAAEPRVAFELALAVELGPLDLARLAAAPAAASKPRPRPRRSRGGGATGVARLVGPGPAMRRVHGAVLRYAPLDTPVLVLGETGTGKELVARALHEEGPRAARPFVAVDCGALPDSLLASELFGHARGAFTGATGARRGLLEAAGAGTCFLDEVDSMSPPLQALLLRALEGGEVRPVGADRSRPVRCRIVAAGHADLAARAADGRFRADLYYRLRALELTLPPLRERPEDIGPLARHFLEAGRTDGASVELSGALVAALARHPWPGNVRELRNATDRLRTLHSEALWYDVAAIGVALPSEPAARAPTLAPPAEAVALLGSRTPLRRMDRLRELFRRHRRLSRTEVARTLGVARSTASLYCRALLDEGFVARCRPSRSTRSNYYELAR